MCTRAARLLKGCEAGCRRRTQGKSYRGGGGCKDKGDSSSVRKRGYTGGGGGRGYRGDVRNINRGSGLPAGAHSVPNTYCHSD